MNKKWKEFSNSWKEAKGCRPPPSSLQYQVAKIWGVKTGLGPKINISEYHAMMRMYIDEPRSKLKYIKKGKTDCSGFIGNCNYFYKNKKHAPMQHVDISKTEYGRWRCGNEREQEEMIFNQNFSNNCKINLLPTDVAYHAKVVQYRYPKTFAFLEKNKGILKGLNDTRDKQLNVLLKDKELCKKACNDTMELMVDFSMSLMRAWKRMYELNGGKLAGKTELEVDGTILPVHYTKFGLLCVPIDPKQPLSAEFLGSARYVAYKCFCVFCTCLQSHLCVLLFVCTLLASVMFLFAILLTSFLVYFVLAYNLICVFCCLCVPCLQLYGFYLCL